MKKKHKRIVDFKKSYKVSEVFFYGFPNRVFLSEQGRGKDTILKRVGPPYFTTLRLIFYRKFFKNLCITFHIHDKLHFVQPDPKPSQIPSLKVWTKDEN